MNNFSKIGISTFVCVFAVAAQATNRTNCTPCGQDLCNTNSCSTVFDAVARIGNATLCNAYGSNWEQGIGKNKNTMQSTKNYSWGNNRPTEFSVCYTAANKKITYRLAGQVLTYDVSASKLDKIMIDTKSTSCSSLKFDQLMFNGQSIAAQFRPNVTGNQSKSYKIESSQLNSDWCLNGTVRMQWTGRPSGNDIRMDISGVECVPEPASMTALAMGALAMLRRKKSA